MILLSAVNAPDGQTDQKKMAAWNVIISSAAAMLAGRYGLIQLFVGMGHAPFVDLPMLAWNYSIAAEL